MYLHVLLHVSWRNKVKKIKNECYVRIRFYYSNDFVHILNEGLPTKWSDISVKYNDSSIEKDVGTAIKLSIKDF